MRDAAAEPCYKATMKGGKTVNLEIHKPELVQRVNAQIQSRHLPGVDELLEQALDALDEKFPTPATAVPEKDIEQLFAPFARPQSGFQP
jgi:hypothetical protein